MEAKVDIRKLQLLNDRINQTIDALNQVRLSVHGLSHTAGLQGQIPGFGLPFGGVGAMGMQGLGPMAQQGLGGWGGMSHTGGVPGIGMSPWGGMQGIYGQSPYGQNPLLAQLLGVSPFGQQVSPFGQQVSPFQQGGFSHTGGVEQLDPTRQIYAQWLLQQQMQQSQIDPYYQMRVQQTFPFAGYPVSPVG